MPLNFLWSIISLKIVVLLLRSPCHLSENAYNYKPASHCGKNWTVRPCTFPQASFFCAWEYFANLSSNHGNHLELPLLILFTYQKFTSTTIYANKITSGDMPSVFLFSRRKFRGFVDWVGWIYSYILCLKNLKIRTLASKLVFWVIF